MHVAVPCALSTCDAKFCAFASVHELQQGPVLRPETTRKLHWSTGMRRRDSSTWKTTRWKCANCPGDLAPHRCRGKRFKALRSRAEDAESLKAFEPFLVPSKRLPCALIPLPPFFRALAKPELFFGFLGVVAYAHAGHIKARFSRGVVPRLSCPRPLPQRLTAGGASARAQQVVPQRVRAQHGSPPERAQPLCAQRWGGSACS